MMSQEERWLLNDKYDGKESSAFFDDCERLAAGMLLGYIIGWVPFLSSKIWLDSKPLIPRPETEFWVGKAIESIKHKNQTFQLTERFEVLDLCAGSGCIGVAVAQAIPQVRVDFAELDARHLPTIKKNIETNGIDEQTTNVFQSDLFANVPGPYDLILSNPPYVDPALDRVEPSVKEHEPHHALYGGVEGLELITHIITAAPQFLKKNGQLWIEHEPEQMSAIQGLAKKGQLVSTTHTDQYGVERYSILTVS